MWIFIHNAVSMDGSMRYNYTYYCQWDLVTCHTWSHQPTFRHAVRPGTKTEEPRGWMKLKPEKAPTGKNPIRREHLVVSSLIPPVVDSDSSLPQTSPILFSWDLLLIPRIQHRFPGIKSYNAAAGFMPHRYCKGDLQWLYSLKHRIISKFRIHVGEGDVSVVINWGNKFFGFYYSSTTTFFSIPC